MSLVDLLPRLHDLATDGAPLPDVSPLHGHSLIPLLGNGSAEWDHPVISEYTGEGTCAPVRMVRRGQFKYIYTHGHPVQLFDLQSGPLELEDLAASAAHGELCSELHTILMGGWDPVDVNDRARANQAERHFINQATGGEPYWAYVARPGDGERFVRNASAVGTKAIARFPFVDAVPFEN